MVPEVFWAHGYCIRNLLNGLVFQEDPVEPVVIPEGSVSEPGLVAQGGKCVQVTNNPETGGRTNGLASLRVVSASLSW